VRAVALVQVAEVGEHRLRRAAAIRLQVPRDADARLGRGVEYPGHERVGGHALRVTLDLKSGLAPPGEHDGVDAGLGQLTHLRQERRVVRRRVQPASGIVRGVRVVGRRVRDARRVLLVHLGRPVRHGPVVPVKPLPIDGRRSVPEIESGVHVRAAVGRHREKSRQHGALRKSPLS
jgi:hypothetical protein